MNPAPDPLLVHLFRPDQADNFREAERSWSVRPARVPDLVRESLQDPSTAAILIETEQNNLDRTRGVGTPNAVPWGESETPTDCWVLCEENDTDGVSSKTIIPVRGNEEAIRIITEYLERVWETDQDLPSRYDFSTEEFHLPTVRRLYRDEDPSRGRIFIEKLDPERVREAFGPDPVQICQDPEELAEFDFSATDPLAHGGILNFKAGPDEDLAQKGTSP